MCLLGVSSKDTMIIIYDTDVSRRTLRRREKEATMSPEELAQRRQTIAARQRMRRALMTPEQRKAEWQRRKAKKTPEQVQAHRDAVASRSRRKRADMTPEEREAWKEARRAADRERRQRRLAIQRQVLADDSADSGKSCCGRCFVLLLCIVIYCRFW